MRAVIYNRSYYEWIESFDRFQVTTCCGIVSHYEMQMKHQYGTSSDVNSNLGVNGFVVKSSSRWLLTYEDNNLSNQNLECTAIYGIIESFVSTF